MGIEYFETRSIEKGIQGFLNNRTSKSAFAEIIYAVYRPIQTRKRGKRRNRVIVSVTPARRDDGLRVIYSFDAGLEAEEVVQQ